MVDDRVLRKTAHRVEDERHHIIWNGLTAVMHGENHMLLIGIQSNGHWPLVIAMLHGIADQVGKNLLHPCAIEFTMTGSFWLEKYRGTRVERPQFINDALAQGQQIQALCFNRYAGAHLATCQIQQVTDNLTGALDAGVNLRGNLRGLGADVF